MSAEARRAQLREEFVPVVAVQGPPVGIVPCSICGAAIVLDQKRDRVTEHHLWHERTGTE